MSGAEQFRLDVDVDSLRAAQYGLQRLAEHLATVATTTNRIPADIGDGWTGPAATVMKAELVGLGIQSTRFGPMFDDAAMALRTFADAAETFQTETLPRYIRGWDRAESEARSAYDKADRAFDEQIRAANSLPDHGAGSQARAQARNINGNARGQVATGQRAAMAAMTSQFSELKAELAQIARATGDAMAGLTVVAVPDSVARDFIGHHGSGQSFSRCNVDGNTLPPDLGTDAALPGMTLVGRKHAIQDGQEVAGALQGWREHGGEIDPAVLAMLQRRQGDPDFASTLLQELGPGAVAALPGELSQAHLLPTLSNDEQMRGEYAWRKSAPDLLKALGVVLAAGTSATGDAALPDTWTPGFLAAARKDSYAPVVALVWAAQKSRPGVPFGTGFLTQSMNAITDYVSADIDIPNTEHSTNNLGRLTAALGAYASASSYIANPGRDAGDLPDGWLTVGDPLHTMFAALGQNPQASTQWLHQGLPPAAGQVAQGQLMSGRVGFWLQKHPVFQGPDQFLWGADNGAALGAVLEAGMTSGVRWPRTAPRARRSSVRWAPVSSPCPTGPGPVCGPSSCTGSTPSTGTPRRECRTRRCSG